MTESQTPDPHASEDAHAPRTVNVTQPWTRAYWARYFEVPVERIEAAVAAVGEAPAAVAAHLGKTWPSPEGGIV